MCTGNYNLYLLNIYLRIQTFPESVLGFTAFLLAGFGFSAAAPSPRLLFFGSVCTGTNIPCLEGNQISHKNFEYLYTEKLVHNRA